jgi:ribonuclease D
LRTIFETNSLSCHSFQSLPRYRRKKYISKFDSAATVQLATPKSCLVVHLVRSSGHHSRACAPILKAVLCDEIYVKAGCALDEDLVSLYDVFGGGLEAKSRLDLGQLVIVNSKEEKPFGLKHLSRAILGVDLPKPKSIAVSDWSSVPLTQDQIIYSARDAWAGAAIAERLAEYDPESFGHAALVESLQHSETQISIMVQRQRRRDRAKRDLGRLLKPYRGKDIRRLDMPESVKRVVRSLREVIKEPVIQSRNQMVLETDQLDFDIF